MPLQQGYGAATNPRLDLHHDHVIHGEAVVVSRGVVVDAVGPGEALRGVQGLLDGGGAVLPPLFIAFTRSLTASNAWPAKVLGAEP